MFCQPVWLYQGDPLIRKKLIFKQVSLWLCFSVQKCRVCGMKSSFLNRLLCGCVFQSTKCRLCGMKSSFLNRLLCGCVFQSTKCRVCGIKSSLCGQCDCRGMEGGPGLVVRHARVMRKRKNSHNPFLKQG